MRVEARAVRKGREGEVLPPTSVVYESGLVTLVRAETERRPTILGLVLSGRMAPDGGTVLLDGAVDAGALRRRVALVDAPEISEPEGALALGALVREELLYARLPRGKDAVARVLAGRGAVGQASRRVEDVDPALRVDLLASLASARPGVDGIVLTHPDRHGGDPEDWLRTASRLAEEGYAVAVTAADASVRFAAALRDRFPRVTIAPLTEPDAQTEPESGAAEAEVAVREDGELR